MKMKFFQDSCFLLIASEDRERIDQTFNKAKSQITKSNSNIEYISINSEEVSSFNSISSVARSRSLFKYTKVILINGVDKLKTEFKHDLIELLKEFRSSTKWDVFFLISAPKIPANSLLVKYAKSCDCFIKLESLKGDALVKWCQKQLTSEGISKSSVPIARRIVAIAEENPDTIVQLAKQCANFIDEDEALTQEHLNELFIFDEVGSSFELIDSIVANDRREVLFKLRKLIDNGVSPFALVGLIYRTFSTYDRIATLLASKLSSSLIAKKIGSPDWLVKKHIKAINRYRVSNFYPHLLAITKASEQLRNKSLGDDVVLEELILFLSPNSRLS